MGKLAGCSKGQVPSSRTGIGRGGGMLLLALGGVLLMGAQTPALAQGCFTWMDRTTAGPSPRADHAMAYDSVRGVTVLFGGSDPNGYNGETWEWDGTTWTLRSSSDPNDPNRPSARCNHAMAYDSARGVTVLFGGYDGSYHGETWEWDGPNSTWTLRSSSDPNDPNRPRPSDRHAMAYDSVRGVTVLFTGDTREWDGTSWTLRSSIDPNDPNRPSVRIHHEMAYDSVRGVTVLFGGWDGSLYGDTWEWDGTSWTLRSSSDPNDPNRPSPRTGHAMAYDSVRGVTVLFGGRDSGPVDSETWEWDGTSWTLRSISGPWARYRHAMAYDSVRGVTVLFGGNDGWFDGETWETTGECLYRLDLTLRNAGPSWVELEPNDPNGFPFFYPPGTELTLTGMPVGGKSFKKWKIWDANDPNIMTIDTNNPTTILMSADRKVKAIFKCGGGGIEGAFPLLTAFGALGLLALTRRRR